MHVCFMCDYKIFGTILHSKVLDSFLSSGKMISLYLAIYRCIDVNIVDIIFNVVGYISIVDPKFFFRIFFRHKLLKTN